MLNFNSLRSNVSPQIEPQKLFTTLTNRIEKFKRPHDEQGDILKDWFSRRESKDLVIKMNTGGGKTIVGLLCLQSSLNEGVFPAVYITPDNNLSQQVIQEAKDLGIKITSNETDINFLSGKSILVANISKLFNGKSVFGVDNRKIDIGAIVIDDAHSCLSIVEKQFSISLPKGSTQYQNLLDLFRDSLHQQASATLLDIEYSNPLSYLTVPYWAWQDKHFDVLKILHSAKDSEELQWSYPLLKDHLKLCSCIFSGINLEIKPSIIPTNKLPSFFNAKRRIYMTATLADDSLLVTHFGANVESIKKPIYPTGGGDMGNRMILSPQEINPMISDKELKNMIEDISRNYNVIVIVPSKYRARYWEDIAIQVLDTNNISEGVAKLKSGVISNGITVLINRYDGIDLPGDACRLLVIDGLPDVYNLHEREEITLLDGTYPQLAKQIQRIEQGMGRGIRSSDDSCAVILLGAQLIHKIHLPQARKIFSPATLAQLQLGQEISEQIGNASVKDIRDTLDYSLTQNSQWIQTCKDRTLNGISIKEPYLDNFRLSLKVAHDYININQIDLAISELQKIVNSDSEDNLKGFIKQKLAEIVNLKDSAQAQELQLSALKLNMNLLKPINGITYSKLSNHSSSMQAQQVKDYLSKRKFNTNNDFLIEANKVLSDLVFDNNGTKSFEKAIDDLGKILGFFSQRPENDFGHGPDNLWSLGNSIYWIIECKSGATKTTNISKHDINQLSGSAHWFQEKYKHCTGIPVMIHPLDYYTKESSPHPEMHVINSTGLDNLRKNVRKYVENLKINMSVDDIKNLLESNSLMKDKLLSTIAIKPRLSQ